MVILSTKTRTSHGDIPNPAQSRGSRIQSIECIAITRTCLAVPSFRLLWLSIVCPEPDVLVVLASLWSHSPSASRAPQLDSPDVLRSMHQTSASVNYHRICVRGEVGNNSWIDSGIEILGVSELSESTTAIQRSHTLRIYPEHNTAIAWELTGHCHAHRHSSRSHSSCVVA